MNQFKLVFLIVLTVTAFFSISHAEGTTKNIPVKFQADTVTASQQGQTIILEGNAVVEQGADVIKASRIVIHLFPRDSVKNGQRIREMVATGSVRMNYENRKATSEKAVFEGATQILSLSGDPATVSGPEGFIECGNIIIDRANETTKCTGQNGEPATGTIFSEEGSAF